MELSIVTPVLLLLIFATVQVALWLYGRTIALQSARQGVSHLRVVVVGSDVPSAIAAAEAEAEQYARRVGGESIIDPAATATITSGQRVQVEVRGRAVSLVPGLTLGVRGVAQGEIEQFEVDQ